MLNLKSAFPLNITPKILTPIVCAMALSLSGCVSRSSAKTLSLGNQVIEPQVFLRDNFAEPPSNTENISPIPRPETHQIADQETEQNFSALSSVGFKTILLYWPVDKGIMTSPFGTRTVGRLTRMHNGIDIGASRGTLIRAAAAGVVSFSGKKHGYGSAVVVAHDQVHDTLYAHLSSVYVKKGALVKRGQVLGVIGRTGHTTGLCLHFETHIHGGAVNPIAFLPPSAQGKRMHPGLPVPSLAAQIKFYNDRRWVSYLRDLATG